MLSWKQFGSVHAWRYRLTEARFGARMGAIEIASVSTVERKSER